MRKSDIPIGWIKIINDREGLVKEFANRVGVNVNQEIEVVAYETIQAIEGAGGALRKLREIIHIVK